MARSHVGCRLGGKVVQLDGRNALVDTTDHALGNLSATTRSAPVRSPAQSTPTHLDGLQMVRIQSVAELVDAGGAKRGGEEVSPCPSRRGSGIEKVCSHLVERDKLPAAICEGEKVFGKKVGPGGGRRGERGRGRGGNVNQRRGACGEIALAFAGKSKAVGGTRWVRELNGTWHLPRCGREGRGGGG